MDTLSELIAQSGFRGLTWQNLIMFGISGLLIYLAVKKNYEPLLLIPIGFGAMLANLPAAMLSASSGFHAEPGQTVPLLQLIYSMGIKTQLLPPVIFMGGGRADRLPTVAEPTDHPAARRSGPVGHFRRRARRFLPVRFHSRGSGVDRHHRRGGRTDLHLPDRHSRPAPAGRGGGGRLQLYGAGAGDPTTDPASADHSEERAINMPQARPVSQTAVIAFPIFITVLTALAIPSSAPLIGMLMFGNLLRESGVTDRLSKTAGGALINIVTIFLGLVVGATMQGDTFLSPQTLFILVLGAVAFAFSTAGGILFARLLNLILPEGKRINPCIGAAGVSAVPMSARVVQKFVSEQTDGEVNPLMAAMGPNVAGVIGSAVAAGMFLALLR
jgi:Na+-transporting methylmalonyl-CoA/oxaloacetate decarboxylase beta subunit